MYPASLVPGFPSWTTHPKAWWDRQQKMWTFDSDKVLTLAPWIEQDVSVCCRVSVCPEDAKGSPDSNIQAKLPNNAGGRGHDGQANRVVLLVGNLGSPLSRFQYITYQDRDVGAFVLLRVATWREREGVITPWRGSPCSYNLFISWQSSISLSIFNRGGKLSADRNHLPPSLLNTVPGHLAVQLHKYTQHLPAGSLCRHPHLSHSSKLQSHWLRHCEDCSPGSMNRACPRISMLTIVCPSAASCTPACSLPWCQLHCW